VRAVLQGDCSSRIARNTSGLPFGRWKEKNSIGIEFFSSFESLWTKHRAMQLVIAVTRGHGVLKAEHSSRRPAFQITEGHRPARQFFWNDLVE